MNPTSDTIMDISLKVEEGIYTQVICVAVDKLGQVQDGMGQTGISWRDIGANKPRQGSWLRVFTILLSVAFFWVIAASDTVTQANWETILFRATMPSLEEELIFRGILWVLIAQALLGTKRL